MTNSSKEYKDYLANKEKAIHFARTVDCRYDLFALIGAACEMRKTEEDTRHRYSKMVRTGKIEVFDYNEGFLEFSIFYSCQGNKNHPKHFARLYISSIDDSCAGAWREFDSKSDCFTFIDNFSSSVIQNMKEFPSLEELNLIVCKHEMWVEIEN